MAAPDFLGADIQRKYKCMMEEVDKRIMRQNLWENKAKIFLDNSYYSYCLRLYLYDKYDNEIRQLDETEVFSLPDYKENLSCLIDFTLLTWFFFSLIMLCGITT